MLKGHVQIDLHNHNSGFKERIEGDNMITDALKYLIQNLAGAQALSYAMPIYQRLLGSLMLFDAKLEEDKSNIFFPGENAHLVAFAGRDTNTSSPITGSLNAIESHATDNGYVNVWDFGTSQANATIQSLALTYADGSGKALIFRSNAGFSSHNALMYNGNKPNNDTRAKVLCYDKEKQLLYCMVQGGIIYKQYIPTWSYGIKDSVNEASGIEYVKTISDMPSNYYTAMNDAYDGYAYLFTDIRNDSASGSCTFSYYTVKLSDYSFEKSETKQVTVKNCALLTDVTSARVSKGHAIIQSLDRTLNYIINLSNPESIIQVKAPEGYTTCEEYKTSVLRNGGIKVRNRNGNNYKVSIIYLDGKSVDYEEDSSLSGNMLTDNLGTYTYTLTGGICSDYLGSIFNLSQPITKTAETSMKVTYTLTDVDE